MFNWVGSTAWLDLALVHGSLAMVSRSGYWTSHRLVGSSCWHFEAERHHQGNGANLSTIYLPWNDSASLPGRFAHWKSMVIFFWWFDDFRFFLQPRSAPENQWLEGDSLLRYGFRPMFRRKCWLQGVVITIDPAKNNNFLVRSFLAVGNNSSF